MSKTMITGLAESAVLLTGGIIGNAIVITAIVNNHRELDLLFTSLFLTGVAMISFGFVHLVKTVTAVSNEEL